ncbi:MAG: Fe-S cluster assembly protein SufD [Gammaproteobacteria bacterium]
MSLAAVAQAGAGFLESILQTVPPLAAPSAGLIALRARCAAQLQSLALPTTRDEEWRFTDLTPLLRQTYSAAGDAPTITLAALEPWLLPEAAASRLVFVNGVYAPHLSARALPAGVHICLLSEVLADSAIAARVSTALDASGDQTIFAVLNAALCGDGAVLLVEANQVIAAPLHVLFVSVPQSTAHVAAPRCLVLAERGSQATIVEDYVSLADGNYFNTAVSEWVLGEGAQVNHAKLQREAPSAFHIATTAVSLARDAQYLSTSITLGARLSRHDVRVRLAGEGAHCTVNGLNLLAGRQLGDTHSLIDHAMPHCTSTQLHKCIVDDNAHAVFNGKVRVRRDAQKTDSRQSSRNLLLSEKARVDTKPELQIDADDVKCAHGATVGQLDMDEVFYLQSRGLSQSASRSLLTFAFAAEIIDQLPVASLHDSLRRWVIERMHVEVLP